MRHLSVKQASHFVYPLFPLVVIDLVWYFKSKYSNVLLEDQFICFRWYEEILATMLEFADEYLKM